MKNLKKYTSLILTALVICSTAIAQNTPAAFKVPAYEKFVLQNGLSIYLQDKMFSSEEQIKFVLSKGN